MHTIDSRLVTLRAKNTHDELRRLNRVTGLEFQSVPESLLGRQEDWEAFAESLLAIAIATWKGDIT